MGLSKGEGAETRLKNLGLIDFPARSFLTLWYLDKNDTYKVF
nr:hypothetical protein [uncultured Flavobacterium sp.]